MGIIASDFGFYQKSAVGKWQSAIGRRHILIENCGLQAEDSCLQLPTSRSSALPYYNPQRNDAKSLHSDNSL
jgi:hypothetical protein